MGRPSKIDRRDATLLAVEPPFTSPVLRDLGIEVVTHLRPHLYSFTSNAAMELLPISVPRVRCLEIAA